MNDPSAGRSPRPAAPSERSGLRRLLAALLLAGLPAVAAAQTTFTVSGSFAYEDKAWGPTGWTGVDPELPIRQADVYVYDMASVEVVGRGVTDDAGDFGIDCETEAGAVDVMAVVVADTSLHKQYAGPFTRVRVLDPDGYLYAAYSMRIDGHDPQADLDLGTTTVLKATLGADEGNPFNLFDMGVAAVQYVMSDAVGGKAKKKGFRMVWPNDTGSFASGDTTWIDIDDGYDDAVVLHEIGHLIHNLYSDSDSPGGIHYLGDSDQDPRLSFGEGYATFFSGTVQVTLGHEAHYLDCDGQAQVGGSLLRVRLEDAAPYSSMIAGEADEMAVACALFDLLDDETSPGGPADSDDDDFTTALQVSDMSVHGAWWRVFRGPVKKAKKLGLHHAWDGWIAEYGGDGAYDGMRAAFDGMSVHFWEDAAEPDDTRAQATVVVPDGSWSPVHTLYRSDDEGVLPGERDSDWFAFELTAGQTLTVETRYPHGAPDAETMADTFLLLYDPQNEKVETDNNGGTGRNAAIVGFAVEQTGTWTLKVRSKNNFRRYGRYQLRALAVDP